MPDATLALKDSCYPTVIQDRRTIAAERIRTMAEAAAASLAPFRGGRVVLATRRVDAISAALHACQASGCDLLLLREAPAADAPAWAAWQVTAVLDDDLSVTELDNVSPNVT